MELQQVRYFIRIAELGSFSRAAQQLNVAQPALSRHVQSLEAEFGTLLLARTTRGVSVTEAGRALVEHGLELLNGADALRDAVYRASLQPGGEVSVGLPPTFSPEAAKNFVDDCYVTFPKIRLRVVEGYSVFLEEWLDRGELDIAIISNRPSAQRFETTELYREDFLLVGRLQDALTSRETVTREDIAGLDLVLPRSYREIISEQLGPDMFRRATEVDNFAIILDMVDRGLAASFLPRSQTEQDEWRGRFAVRPIGPRAPYRSFLVASKSRGPRSAAVVAVRDAMIKRLKRGTATITS